MESEQYRYSSIKQQTANLIDKIKTKCSKLRLIIILLNSHRFSKDVLSWIWRDLLPLCDDLMGNGCLTIFDFIDTNNENNQQRKLNANMTLTLPDIYDEKARANAKEDIVLHIRNIDSTLTEEAAYAKAEGFLVGCNYMAARVYDTYAGLIAGE